MAFTWVIWGWPMRRTTRKTNDLQRSVHSLKSRNDFQSQADTKCCIHNIFSPFLHLSLSLYLSLSLSIFSPPPPLCLAHTHKKKHTHTHTHTHTLCDHTHTHTHTHIL